MIGGVDRFQAQFGLQPLVNGEVLERGGIERTLPGARNWLMYGTCGETVYWLGSAWNACVSKYGFRMLPAASLRSPETLVDGTVDARIAITIGRPLDLGDADSGRPGFHREEAGDGPAARPLAAARG